MSFNNKVYWDDECYVCSLEIELLQNKNPNCNIEFIKISSLKDKTNYTNEMIGEFNGIKTNFHLLNEFYYYFVFIGKKC